MSIELTVKRHIMDGNRMSVQFGGRVMNMIMESETKMIIFHGNKEVAVMDFSIMRKHLNFKVSDQELGKIIIEMHYFFFKLIEKSRTFDKFMGKFVKALMERDTFHFICNEHSTKQLITDGLTLAKLTHGVSEVCGDFEVRPSGWSDFEKIRLIKEHNYTIKRIKF